MALRIGEEAVGKLFELKKIVGLGLAGPDLLVRRSKRFGSSDGVTVYVHLGVFVDLVDACFHGFSNLDVDPVHGKCDAGTFLGESTLLARRDEGCLRLTDLPVHGCVFGDD